MQTLRYVLLPQAMRIMAPSFVNQWVSLVKDSSLAYIVGVGELSFVATQVSNRLMVYPAQIFLFVGFIYLVLCTALDRVAAPGCCRGANASYGRSHRPPTRHCLATNPSQTARLDVMSC